MTISNKLNLPQALYDAAKSSLRPLSEDTYSVTEILNSTREVLLKKRHYNDIIIDVADLIPALFGTGVHKLFEEANKVGKSELKLQFGKLTGICDLYHDLTVEDYKTTSVNKVMYQDFEEHRKQTLMYAYMIMCLFGEKPLKVKINYLMKDWSKVQANSRTGYPQSPIYVHEFDIQDSDYDYIEAFICDKIKSLDDNLNVSDDDLPECTNEEKWNSGDKWAVYKKEGDKRALKVCDTKEEAESYGGYVELRKGANLKCKLYCEARAYCSQFKKEEN